MTHFIYSHRHVSFTSENERRLCYESLSNDGLESVGDRVMIAPKNPLKNDAHWAEIFHKRPDVLLENEVEIGWWSDNINDVSEDISDQMNELTLEERQSIFVDITQRLIGTELLQKHFGMPPNSQEQQQRQFILGNRNIIIKTLAAMHGMEDHIAGDSGPDVATAREAASAALRDHYKLPEGHPTGTNRNPDIRALYDDVTDMFGQLSKQGETSIRDLENPIQLAEKIKPSLLRGAMKREVIGKEDLLDMHKGVRELDTALTASRTDVRQGLDHFLGESKERLKNEANTVVDIWRGMGGGEKMLLLSAVAGLLLWKKTRGWVTGGAGIFAGVYMFQKFVLKQDDPVKSWSRLINGATNNAKENMTIGPDSWVPGYAEESADRAEVMVDFLDEYSIEYIERQSIGFGILSPLPLDILARHFDANGEMQLDIGNSALRTPLKEALRNHGWSETRYQLFFGDPENVRQVSKAMGFMFFVKAVHDSDGEYSNEATDIAEALALLPAGTGISALGENPSRYLSAIKEQADQQKFINAQKTYRRLILKGQELASHDKQTLENFAANIVKTHLVEAGSYIREGVSAPYVPSAGQSFEKARNTGIEKHSIQSAGTNTESPASTGDSAGNVRKPGITSPHQAAAGVDIASSPQSGVGQGNNAEVGTDRNQTGSVGANTENIPNAGVNGSEKRAGGDSGDTAASGI